MLNYKLKLIDAGDGICCGADNLRRSRAPRPTTFALILQLALWTYRNEYCTTYPTSDKWHTGSFISV